MVSVIPYITTRSEHRVVTFTEVQKSLGTLDKTLRSFRPRVNPKVVVPASLYSGVLSEREIREAGTSGPGMAMRRTCSIVDMFKYLWLLSVSRDIIHGHW